MSSDSDSSATPETYHQKAADPYVDSPLSESCGESSSSSSDDDGAARKPKRSNKNGLTKEDEKALLEVIERNNGLDGAWSLELQPIRQLLTLTSHKFDASTKKISDRIRYLRGFTKFEYSSHLKDHDVVPCSKRQSSQPTSSKKSKSKSSASKVSTSKKVSASASKKSAAKSSVSKKSASKKKSSSIKTAPDIEIASPVKPKALFTMAPKLEDLFPGYDTCNLEEDRPTKNNHGAIFSKHPARITPDGKYKIDTWVLQLYIQGHYSALYKTTLVPGGIMFTKPNTAGLLLGQEEERKKYENRAAKLRRARNMHSEDNTLTETGNFNTIADAAKAEPDMYCDHIYFKFPYEEDKKNPEKGKPCQYYPDEADPKNIAHKDVIFYTKEKLVKQKNGADMNLTRTDYLLNIYVGIKGTKKRLKTIDTKTGTDEIADELGGMTLSP